MGCGSVFLGVMDLVLSTYVASKKREIFDRLRRGESPGEGVFDASVMAAAKDLGAPQMGTTVYAPRSIQIEFIYHDPLSSNLVLKVVLDAPERIVFLPVPEWVHQTIWQGEVDGTFRFESEARRLLGAFEGELGESENLKWFEKRLPTTRE